MNAPRYGPLTVNLPGTILFYPSRLAGHRGLRVCCHSVNDYSSAWMPVLIISVRARCRSRAVALAPQSLAICAQHLPGITAPWTRVSDSH